LNNQTNPSKAALSWRLKSIPIPLLYQTPNLYGFSRYYQHH
jgi:hypothetical protein